MTLENVLSVFDEVRPDGDVKCCGVSVVMLKEREVYCLKCSRKIQAIGRQWMVTDWGTKGINLRWVAGLNAFEAVRKAADALVMRMR